MTSDARGICQSCLLSQDDCHWDWFPSVPRPDNVLPGKICGDCYQAIVRYAGIQL